MPSLKPSWAQLTKFSLSPTGLLTGVGSLLLMPIVQWLWDKTQLLVARQPIKYDNLWPWQLANFLFFYVIKDIWQIRLLLHELLSPLCTWLPSSQLFSVQNMDNVDSCFHIWLKTLVSNNLFHSCFFWNLSYLCCVELSVYQKSLTITIVKIHHRYRIYMYDYTCMYTYLYIHACMYNIYYIYYSKYSPHWTFFILCL